jgi:hypothetical protein
MPWVAASWGTSGSGGTHACTWSCGVAGAVRRARAAARLARVQDRGAGCWSGAATTPEPTPPPRPTRLLPTACLATGAPAPRQQLARLTCCTAPNQLLPCQLSGPRDVVESAAQQRGACLAAAVRRAFGPTRLHGPAIAPGTAPCSRPRRQPRAVEAAGAARQGAAAGGAGRARPPPRRPRRTARRTSTGACAAERPAAPSAPEPRADARPHAPAKAC